MLEARSLIKRFPNGFHLGPVNLQLQPGQAVAIQGPNGSGKTTLLKLLSGLIRPHAGDILFKQQPINNMQHKLYQYMAYLGHVDYLYDDLSVLENIAYYSKLYQQGQHKKVSSLRLTDVSMQAHQDSLVGILSHGQRKRVALLLCLMHTPEILLLDEPFTGLDQEAVEVLEKLLKQQLEQGMAIGLSTHRRQLPSWCEQGLIL